MAAESDLPEGDQAAMPASVAIGGTDVPVWPQAQAIYLVAGAQMATTHFADFAAYHPVLIAATLAAEHDPRFHDPKHLAVHAGCGAKVRDLQAWNVPAATLVHARALMFAHHSLAQSAVFADDTWASVYRDRDYCMPHCHPRSDVSIVYMLDRGDADPADSVAGRLCFTDPRIAWCCSMEPGRVTRPLMPKMTPGTMLVFASAYLHSVNPYRGAHPRITLSWNITRQRLPGRPRDWVG